MELVQEEISLVQPNNHSLDLFAKLREESLAKIGQMQFPTSRVENWKYTRVGKISNHEWKSESNESSKTVTSYLIPDWQGSTLVFENGVYKEGLSDIKSELENVKVKALSNACENCLAQLEGRFSKYTKNSANIFDQINNANWQDGLFLFLPKNTKLENPIHVVMIIDGNDKACHMRNTIILEEGAHAEVVLSVVGTSSGKTFQNVITEAFVDQNAQLSLDKIQISGSEEFQMCTEAVYQKKDSLFSINTMTIDAGWVRNDLKIDIEGENCESNLYGVYLPIQNQHVDNHTVVDHQKAHCNSNEMYKGVVYDKGTGVFNGKVFVREDAQKTNAFQANNNIVMSEDASMNSKPELEIYADDVKCSHGSTTGQFDEEAVFYLRARGIGEKNARRLLVEAFLSDALGNLKNEDVKAYVQNLLEEKQAKILA